MTGASGAGERAGTLLLDLGAARFCARPPFRLRSGLAGPIYTDCRLLCGDPTARREATAMLATLAGFRPPDVIAAVATAGIPHAAWLAEALGLPLVYVRPEAKSYGLGRRIEGLEQGEGREALVVEDTVTTGSGLLTAVEALRAEGYACRRALALLHYGLPIAREALRAADMTCLAWCSGARLVEAAEQMGRIDANLARSARAWLADPRGWEEGDDDV